MNQSETPHSALGSTPYERLPGASLQPGSLHDEVLDVALELQSRGEFTAAMRLDWDQLRTAPRRLAIDFFLFDTSPVDHRARFQAALEACRRAEGIRP